MRNLNIPDSLQEEVRDFIQQTSSSLDSQTELKTFMAFLSPKLHDEVQRQIFINACSDSNIISIDNEHIQDTLVAGGSLELFSPEDKII